MLALQASPPVHQMASPTLLLCQTHFFSVDRIWPYCYVGLKWKEMDHVLYTERADWLQDDHLSLLTEGWPLTVCIYCFRERRWWRTILFLVKSSLPSCWCRSSAVFPSQLSICTAWTGNVLVWSRIANRNVLQPWNSKFIIIWWTCSPKNL